MKYIIIFFIIKQIFSSDYCGIDHQCGYCDHCWENESNYCSCHFYNGFCYNNTKNGYSYNTSFLFGYDRNKCQSKYDFEDICGVSDISSKISDEKFYKFFSFDNPEYLENNNLLCYYTFNNKEKSKEYLLLEIEVVLNHQELLDIDNGKNLMIIFVQEFDSSTKTLYEINLNEFIKKKVTVKIEPYQSISIYISLIKKNDNFNNIEIQSMNVGIKRDNAKALQLKRYKYSLIIICIICIICVGSCFILYLIKYKRNRELLTLRAINMANNLNELGNQADPQEKRNKLENLFKTKLKKRKYLKKDNVNETTACSICLEEFVENKSIVCITLCKHVFHYDCLHNWLFTENSNSHCPYCNYDLLSDKKPMKRHKIEETKKINDTPGKQNIIDNKNIINNEINNDINIDVNDGINNHPKKEIDDYYNTSERVIKKYKSNKNKNKTNDINNNIENKNDEINIVDEEIKNDIKSNNDNDISFESDFNKIKNNENIMKNYKENNENKNKENIKDIKNDVNNINNEDNDINNNIENKN